MPDLLLTTPPQLLDAALRRDPARPLITFYDDRSGERVELSVVTFATWVAKTANLLRDDLDLRPGARVVIDLPLHWQAAVWLQACWTLGAHVALGSAAPLAADLLVTSYDRAPGSKGDAGEVVALGLGPMGLPRRDVTAPVWADLDYDREVAGHGDRFVPSGPVDPDAAALTLGAAGTERTLTAADLVAHTTDATALPEGARLLVTEQLTTLDAIQDALLRPLAGTCTAVLCRHLDPALLPARIAQEGIVARR